MKGIYLLVIYINIPNCPRISRSNRRKEGEEKRKKGIPYLLSNEASFAKLEGRVPGLR